MCDWIDNTRYSDIRTGVGIRCSSHTSPFWCAISDVLNLEMNRGRFETSPCRHCSRPWTHQTCPKPLCISYKTRRSQQKLCSQLSYSYYDRMAMLQSETSKMICNLEIRRAIEVCDHAQQLHSKPWWHSITSTPLLRWGVEYTGVVSRPRMS